MRPCTLHRSGCRVTEAQTWTRHEQLQLVRDNNSLWTPSTTSNMSKASQPELKKVFTLQLTFSEMTMSDSD